MLSAGPTEKHLKEVKRIFRYLRGTIHIGLWYPKGSGFELTAFSDADHASFLYTRKSTSEGIQSLGDKLVSWMSKKQDCNCNVIYAEAEYVGYSDKLSIAIHATRAALLVPSISTRYHFIKEQVENGIIELYFVRTEYQLADMFTKSPSEERFQYPRQTYLYEMFDSSRTGGICPMIQPEPEGSTKDTHELENRVVGLKKAALHTHKLRKRRVNTYAVRITMLIADIEDDIMDSDAMTTSQPFEFLSNELVSFVTGLLHDFLLTFSLRNIQSDTLSYSNDEWNLPSVIHQQALAVDLRFELENLQGDSLNLPDHRIHIDGDGDASFPTEVEFITNAHAQTTKTFYKHQDYKNLKVIR
ncbi:hypothetical protein Tco_0863407 [Tanacetum coccineum]